MNLVGFFGLPVFLFPRLSNHFNSKIRAEGLGGLRGRARSQRLAKSQVRPCRDAAPVARIEDQGLRIVLLAVTRSSTLDPRRFIYWPIAASFPASPFLFGGKTNWPCARRWRSGSRVRPRRS